MRTSFVKKYRPSKFSEVITQDNIKLILRNIINNQIKAQSFLFYGERGSGKTSIARIFAKSINCENFKNEEPCNMCQSCISIQNQTNIDVIEIDSASNNSVENIRSLIENAKYLPQSSKKKIYILDEVHMLSLSAFNSLLKIIEEPPSYLIFILITTEYKKIPLTVISRCIRLNFKKPNFETLYLFLEDIAKKESIKFEKKALEKIVQLSEFIIRDAVSLLDSLSILSLKNISLDVVCDHFSISHDIELIFNIFELLLINEIESIFEIIDKFCDESYDILYFLNLFINFLSEIILFIQIYPIDQLNNNIELNTFKNLKDFSIEKLINFIKSNIDYLNFDKLYNIIKITNESIMIFGHNPYQNENNFLKIFIIKIYFSFKNSENKQITIKNTEGDGIQKINIQNIQENNIVKENNNIIDELIEILKKNNEIELSKMIPDIKFDIDKMCIIDNNSINSRHIQYILKILRKNFDSRWKILLEEKNEIKETKNTIIKLTKEDFLKSNFFLSLKKSFFLDDEDVKFIK